MNRSKSVRTKILLTEVIIVKIHCTLDNISASTSATTVDAFLELFRSPPKLKSFMSSNSKKAMTLANCFSISFAASWSFLSMYWRGLHTVDEPKLHDDPMLISSHTPRFGLCKSLIKIRCLNKTYSNGISILIFKNFFSRTFYWPVLLWFEYRM